MATPIPQTTGSSSGAGTAGESRQDLVIGETVTISDTEAANSSGPWATVLDDVPTGSTAVLTGPTTATPSFVPDLVGSYRFTMTFNGIEAFTTVVAIEHPTTNLRTPGFQEELQWNEGGSSRGWQLSKDALYAQVEQTASDIAVASGGYVYDRYSLPDVAHADDVEWDTGTLPTNVTENFTPNVAPVNPYLTFATSDPKRAINPEWMRRHYVLQPGASSQANIMYAVTLPTNVFVQMPLMMSLKWDGWSATNAPNVSIGACTRSGSSIVWADATYLAIFANPAGFIGLKFVHAETGQTTIIDNSGNTDFFINGIVNCHLGISKRGLTYDLWISTTRNHWQRVPALTNTRLGGASAFDGIFFDVKRGTAGAETIAAIGPIRFTETDKGPFG